MHFLVAFFAYISAAAAGLKILVFAAHFIATSASGSLQLAPQKAMEPTLVERRLTAQAAPRVMKPATRIAALEAPETPVAVLAINLDSAETAYAPPPAITHDAPKISRVRNVQARALHSPRGSLNAARKGPAKAKSGGTQTQIAFNAKNRGLDKMKPDSAKYGAAEGKSTIAPHKTIPVNQFVTTETPGYLMIKGLLSKES